MVDVKKVYYKKRRIIFRKEAPLVDNQIEDFLASM
jgi:uncharacterized phage-associated protein